MSSSRKISIKGIVLGELVDIGGTTLSLAVIMIIMGGFSSLQGATETDLNARITREFAPIIPFLTILGLCFTFWGGFVCARIAKSAEIMHSSIIGIIGIVLGVLSYQPQTGVAFWLNIIALILTIPIAVLGGYVAQGRNLKNTQSLLNTNEKNTKQPQIIDKTIKLPLGVKIVAGYLIVPSLIWIVWRLIGFETPLPEFHAKSTAYKIGVYFREMLLNVLSLTSGIAILFRKLWGRKLAIILLAISVIYDSNDFAWGLSGGTPSVSIRLITIVAYAMLNGFFIYTLYKKRDNEIFY